MPSPTPMFTVPVIDSDHRTADCLARLIRAYDRAIRACEAFDAAGAHDAIAVLRSALELDSSAARSFDALYAWCEEAVDGRDFVGAAQCLRTLRDAWRRAVQPAVPSAERLAVRPPFPPFTDLPLC
ncbi:MAG: hypothetical protein ACK6DP_07910 [Gemmatimonas sp.]|uniref:hypothetical protein n=1 Tax=Gemmatimonas sp. TaxID=1962908 RepID=UPI00391FA22E|nr:flagellar protein FliS [Gemmatimonadota bacterium]